MTVETYTTEKSGPLVGTIAVDADKSISHRSLILSALADGESHIHNLLLGEDVMHTLTILNQLGVKTSHCAGTVKSGETVTVWGSGLKDLKQPKEWLYCGNSGTTMRLLLGMLAAQNFDSTLTGDASLDQRPMDRVIEPLEKMGARFVIEEKEGRRLIQVRASAGLKGLDYEAPIPSAQVKSALLLSGLCAGQEVCVTEPAKSRDHTEIMLKSMGAELTVKKNTVILRPTKSLNPLNINIPGDISSAAFFIVAALIVPASDLTITNVSLNPTRVGVLDVLRTMGAKIEIKNQRQSGGEICGDLRVRYSKLHGCTIKGAIVPRLIDEIPILALAAAFATGRTVVRGAGELRVKETDRIRATTDFLRKLSINIEEKDDGFVIDGQGRPKIPSPCSVSSFCDHRMAMTQVVAGLALDEAIKIDDVTCVRTSFPGFFHLLDKVRRPL